MNIYSAGLSVPVWNKSTDRDSPNSYTPALVFSGDEVILATVRLAVSEKWAPGESRWMVWCPDQSREVVSDLNEYDDGYKRPLFGRGEAHPRDTAKAAIEHALSRIKDQIPDEDHKSLAKAAEILRPILEQTTRFFATTFAPKKAAR